MLILHTLMAQDKAITIKIHVQQLDYIIFCLQYAAYYVAYKKKSLELTPFGSQCDPFPSFAVGDLILCYQKYISGCARKLRNSLYQTLQSHLKAMK